MPSIAKKIEPEIRKRSGMVDQERDNNPVIRNNRDVLNGSLSDAEYYDPPHPLLDRDRCRHCTIAASTHPSVNMKQTGRCPKCECRRLLFIDAISETDGGSSIPLSLCISGPAGVRAGRLKAVVCSKCGFMEWYAQGLEEVMRELGKLSPTARLVDGDLAEAVKHLGLAEDKSAGINGWQFLAQGTYQDVLMTIGQRARHRVTDGGTRDVVRIELLATAKSDLGGYAFQRPDVVGREPFVPYGQPLRTGDAAFDETVRLVRLGPSAPTVATFPLQAQLPLGQIPWLDGEVRSEILAASPEEILVTGKSIGMLLVDYRQETFAHAVELAVRLAKWAAGSEHPYR